MSVVLELLVNRPSVGSEEPLQLVHHKGFGVVLLTMQILSFLIVYKFVVILLNI